MKKNILLVEYSISAVDLIEELFSHPIFEVTVVEEGDAAKKMLATNHYDLMITAAMLPKFHGFNLSLYAAKHYPGLKILIISEIYKGMDYKHQAINQFKADDFFEKPLDKDKFKKRALELLGINEKDLEQQKESATQIPIPDTRKIPTLRKLEKDSNKLTSEDLFGDMLENNEENKPFEIKLHEDLQKDDLLLTQQMPSPALTQVIRKDAGATQMLPRFESLEKEIGVTRPIKIEKPGEPPTTRKIDFDIDELLKIKKEVKKENKETQRFKKIEDDISKKFEDTLSGLGIKGKNSRHKDTNSQPTQPSQPSQPSQPMKLDEALSKTVLELEIPEKDDKKNEVSDYDIIGLIARGGMAEIYKAKKKGVKGFEKIIALKKILAGYGKDDKYIEMFVDEAKIAAELTHPNIVQIYDLGEKDDYYFIAMEYVAGKDLRLILHKLSEFHKVFPEELSLHVILEVLKALNYAHSAKNSSGKNLDIVHRDISPPNILVSFNGDVKLTDFGVSKASIKMHQTIAGALKGKLLYMSPEQARAENDTDQRSDLYSVGIIFFELLTGEKLFMDSSEMAVLHKVQLGEIIRPRELKKDIDPQLEFIILRMLNKDKTRRYQRASDIINDIQAYMTRNYDRMPTAIHISHAIYELFKDEIEKEEIKIDLKPIPYKINRIQRIEMEPPAKPTTSKMPIPPSPTPTPAIPQVPPEQQVEKELIKTVEQETLTEMKEDFHPLVEIEFDDDNQENESDQSSKTTQLLQTVSLNTTVPAVPVIKPEPEFSGMAELQAIKEEEAKKRKKFLLITLALIIIGIIIVFFLINGGKSMQGKTTGSVPQTGIVEKNTPSTTGSKK